MNHSRRDFLSAASALGFSHWFGAQIASAINRQRPSGKFKRCVVLWMEGGPSQMETFDPKDLGDGTSKSIATNVDGIRIGESLPGLARHTDKLCILRSIGSGEGEHARATELLHTGFAPLPSFPRPSFGSMVASERADEGFPRYVTLGGIGFGPAFLGSQHGPFVVEDIKAARQQLDLIERRRRSLDLLQRMNEGYRRGDDDTAVSKRTAAVQSVRRLIDTGFTTALDLKSVSASDRNRYGDDPFGGRVLTARRLLELGVPFVEVQLGGWDTHLDNQRRTAALCRRLDGPWVALMDDLQASGLWDDTLIVWMGEFGRTPTLNGRAGRDHYPSMIPVVLAGGDLGGTVIGETNSSGTARVGTEHSVADLMATMLTLLGLDIAAEYTTDFGSPTTVTDNGEPIKDLV